MEIVNGAARTGLSFDDFLIEAKAAGLDSVPGTAAEILDDDVRWVLTKGKLPTATWLEIITTAHRVGLPTTLDDDVRPRRHPRALGRAPAHAAPRCRTRPAASPSSCCCRSCTTTRRSTSPASPAPGRPCGRTGPCTPSPGCCCTARIHNIQTSWVKLADAGTQAVLQGGANDLGGTLMEETISRMAGSENGSLKTIAELEAMAAAAGRPARQRTTEYGQVSEERRAAALRAESLTLLAARA